MYYDKSKWDLVGFKKSKTRGKMYDAILKNNNNKTVRLPFGSTFYNNYRDITGLNLYPNLIHGDKNRRRLYKARHKVYLKDGYYSPGYFSYYYLW